MLPAFRFGSLGNLYWQIYEDWKVHCRNGYCQGFRTEYSCEPLDLVRSDFVGANSLLTICAC